MSPFTLPEYNSRPNGQKALGPKELLPHPNFWEQYILGLSQDRTWIKDGQGVNNSNIQQCPSRVCPGASPGHMPSFEAKSAFRMYSGELDSLLWIRLFQQEGLCGHWCFLALEINWKSGTKKKKTHSGTALTSFLSFVHEHQHSVKDTSL